MLTINDERWLEGRKVLCPRCDHYRDHVEGKSACFRGEKSGWMQAECRFFQRNDLIPDYKDAAEFEARVATKALTRFDTCNDCSGFIFEDCSWDELSCEAVRLKYARLQVEKEMPI